MTNKEKQGNNLDKSVAEQIEVFCGRWFIPIVGFIYASGFLIVFTFCRGYGINDISFVEAKYIHVGSFFLLACATVILPLGWLKYLLPKYSKYPHLTIPTITGAILMLFVLFAVLAFAPRGFYHEHWIEMIFDLSIPVLLLLSGLFAEWLANRKQQINGASRTAIIVIQWMLLIVQSCAVFLTFKNLNYFWDMWHNEPVWFAFIGLMILIFLYGARLIHRLPQAQNRGQQLNLIISNGCIIGLFAYLAIWSFSRSIYPYIPASKGGGNFSSETPIHLIFKADFAAFVPDEVTKADDANDLILLEENDKFLFVADDTVSGGPPNWQTNNKPPVYEISRDTVITIVHDNSNSLN